MPIAVETWEAGRRVLVEDYRKIIRALHAAGAGLLAAPTSLT